jgi:hypothetical protein
MGRRPARHGLTAALAVLLAAAAPPALAGDGMAEVLLDRGAVGALVAVHFPVGTEVAVPGLGKLYVRFVPPETIDFVEGAVQARVGIRVVEMGVGGSALCRFVPEVYSGGAIVRLRVTSAVPDGPLAGLPNLAGLIPPIDVPAGYAWVAPDRRGGQTAFGLKIQAINVLKDRLQLKLGLTTNPASRRAARQEGPDGAGTGR